MKRMFLAAVLSAVVAGARSEPRPDLVAKVSAGELKEARASWWGFDEMESTAFLQQAINSRVPHLIVDRMEKPWVSRRLMAVSDQKITFEEGAVLEAKRGAFKDPYDTLIRIRSVTNVTFSGYGAEVRMWKVDYTNASLYAWSEWRHAFDVLSAANVTIEGFRVSGSGGDGVYLGEGRIAEPNVNVVLRDLDLVDNNRQAVSVITADGLLMERVKMRHTGGTPPASGVDIEPNHPYQVIRNVRMKDCVAEDNAGGGFEFATPYTDDTAVPLTVTLENCRSKGNKRGLVITQMPLAQRDYRGEIVFANCRFEDATDAREQLKQRHEEFIPFGVRYSDCTFVNPTTRVETVESGGWKANRSLVGWNGASMPLIRPTDGLLSDGRVTVHDEKPGESVPLSRLHIRFQAHYLLYATAGTAVSVKGHLVELSKRKATGNEKLTVRDPSGATMGEYLIRPLQDGGTEIAFTAARTGFHTLSVQTGNHAIALDSSNVAIAAFRSRDTHSPSFSGIEEGDFWFRTRRKGEAFAVLGAGGEGQERIRMRVFDPSGTCVADLDNVMYQRAWKSAKDSPAGVWRVEIRRPSEGVFDDFTCDLAGIPAVLFLSPEKTWTVDRAFDVKRMPQRTIMGKDYWTFLMSAPYVDPAYAVSEPSAATGLGNLPLFREAGIFYNFQTTVPPVGKATFRRLVDNVPGGETNVMWRAFIANAKPSVPKLVNYWSKRACYADVGEIDLDFDEYAAWSAARPDVFAYFTVEEWGSDVHYALPHMRRLRTDAERDEFRRRLLAFPPTRAGRVDALRAYIARKRELYWNDDGRFGEMSSQGFINHLAAAEGARLVMYETTNSNGPNSDEDCRWELCGMNVRGAARQFDRPWIWYVANCYAGWRQDGKTCGYTECSYEVWDDDGLLLCPEGGVSPSLEMRCFYYAYLNGANGVLPEHWQVHMLRREANGKLVLSDRGRQFARYHDFTRRNPDRGVTYAPVAVLTPHNQLYTPWGGRSAYGDLKEYRPGDHQVDGVYFTIVPGRHRGEEIRRGVEGCLHNNELPMMFDLLVPDSGQSRAAFVDRLRAYPAAILAGEYADPTALAGPMGDYVMSGGTLAIPRVYFRIFEPLIMEKSVSGRRIADERGRPMGMAYAIGAGRLIVSESEWMTPPLGEADETIAAIRRGERSFPEIAYYLNAFRKRFFPFKVKGSCLYGANRRRKGWWLWALNNEGVTKFIDATEKIDASKSSEIVVTIPEGFETAQVKELMTGTVLPVRARSFRWKIPAGGVSVFEID